MPGPAPIPSHEAHRKCQNKDKCTGPGCRYRRPKRVNEYPRAEDQ